MKVVIERKTTLISKTVNDISLVWITSCPSSSRFEESPTVFNFTAAMFTFSNLLLFWFESSFKVTCMYGTVTLRKLSLISLLRRLDYWNYVWTTSLSTEYFILSIRISLISVYIPRKRFKAVTLREYQIMLSCLPRRVNPSRFEWRPSSVRKCADTSKVIFSLNHESKIIFIY